MATTVLPAELALVDLKVNGVRGYCDILVILGVKIDIYDWIIMLESI